MKTAMNYKWQMRQMGMKVQMLNLLKKDWIEKSIALGSRMAKLMTDLDLDISSDHVEDEEVDNHNNCTRKSKKSLKLNKSGNMKKKRHVTKSETDTKVWEFLYNSNIMCVVRITIDLSIFIIGWYKKRKNVIEGKTCWTFKIKEKKIGNYIQWKGQQIHEKGLFG
jgi:hypothetical protein